MAIAVAAVIIALVTALTAPASANSAVPVPERSVDFTYRFTVREVPETARQVAAWIPVPPSSPGQQLVSYQVQGAYSHAVLVEPEYGNQFLWFDLSDAPEAPRQVAAAVASLLRE